MKQRMRDDYVKLILTVYSFNQTNYNIQNKRQQKRMYSRAKVLDNNRHYKNVSEEYLKTKNIVIQPALFIPQPHMTNHIINEQQSDEDSNMSDIIAMTKLALEKKNKSFQSIPNTKDVSKTQQRSQQQINKSYEGSYMTSNLNNAKNRQNSFQYKKSFQSNEQVQNGDEDEDDDDIQMITNFMCKNFVPRQKSNEDYSSDNQISYNQYEEPITNISKPKLKEKPKKKQKKQKPEKPQNDTQCKFPISNIIGERNPNLFTIQSLKTKQPLSKNYQVGIKSQWQNNRRIEDYKLQFVLRKFPKINDFRHNQKAIIKCSLLGNDVFVCMPTGGGKSLTFQAMTFIEIGIYLCVLPLVSLMIDQQEQCVKLGIKAYSLTGQTEIQDNKKIYNQIASFNSSSSQSLVIFCTPEKISKSNQFMGAIQQSYSKNTLVKIIIDEVHCVSTWGKQFRKDYQNLSILKKNYPKTPILGLTATVTENIKQDIINQLGIRNCYYFQSSFNRPNLFYQVKEKGKDYLNKILEILSENENKSGIIYCTSRKDCEQMCQTLSAKRYRVAFYHANIKENQKRHIQNSWMRNEIQIIIATIAFGMGINKPDVRFVIHHSLSKSLQDYYQESGRAGRDGQNAKCIIFYRKGDKASIMSLITKNEVSKDQNKNFCMRQLSNMIRYCEDKFTCRRKFQLDYLGETNFNPADCNKTCDNCKRNLSFVEVECIKQAKLLTQFVIDSEQLQMNISQNQIIMICKGISQKKANYKIEHMERNLDLSELRRSFKQWNKAQIDELITNLLSYEIFYEKIFTNKIQKTGQVVSNFYIKVNWSIANKFIEKVQSLPIKRNYNKKQQQQMNQYEFSESELDFADEQGPEDQDDENNTNCSFLEKYNFKN